MENAANQNLARAPETDEVIPSDKKVIFFMLVSCFVLWGLLNNITDNLVPAFGKIFMMSAVQRE